MCCKDAKILGSLKRNQEEMGILQQSGWKKGSLKLGNSVRLEKKENGRCRRKMERE